MIILASLHRVNLSKRPEHNRESAGSATQPSSGLGNHLRTGLKDSLTPAPPYCPVLIHRQ